MKTTRVLHMSPAGIRWLAILEGSHRLRAYQDTAGVWTIGAGITFYAHGVRVKKGDVLESAAVAEQLFRERLLEYEAAVDASTPDTITQTQFDSFVSACFNIGIGAFKSSTFLKRFRKGDSDSAVVEALGWFSKSRNPVNGELRVDPGLMERRKCEAFLFSFGIYKVQGQPKIEPEAKA